MNTIEKLPELMLLPGYDPYSDIEGKNCWYDEEAGQHAVDFIEQYCTHVKGSLAGTPFYLEEWQKCFLKNLFGWKRKDGTRRYRTAILYVPRKNGKTALTAAVILYVMTCDNEEGAEIYSSAVNIEQSSLIFDVTRKMIENDCDDEEECLSDIYKVLKESVQKKEDYLTVFLPLTGSLKGKHGLNAHMLAIDELHEHPDDKLIEPLITSMGARDQPLTVYMTTSDFNRKSPCNEEHKYACDVRDGLIKDYTYLPVIYEALPEDDWKDPEIWAKANPNFNVSVKETFLEAECLKATNRPSYANTFKRLYLNIKTESSELWIHRENWQLCNEEFDLSLLKGARCYGGLDLASKQDITAFSLVFPDFNNLTINKYWLPEGKKLKYHESGWVQEGYITLTPGDIIDMSFIERDILEMVSLYDVKAIAYDPWGASQLASSMIENYGFDMFEFLQSFRNFNEPSVKLEELVMGKKLNNLGNPVLEWMITNVHLARDSAEHIRPDKKKSENKIDGVIALVMALGMMLQDKGTKKSVYETRGIISI